jgi:hypothetical protein
MKTLGGVRAPTGCTESIAVSSRDFFQDLLGKNQFKFPARPSAENTMLIAVPDEGCETKMLRREPPSCGLPGGSHRFCDNLSNFRSRDFPGSQLNLIDKMKESRVCPCRC